MLLVEEGEGGDGKGDGKEGGGAQKDGVKKDGERLVERAYMDTLVNSRIVGMA